MPIRSEAQFIAGRHAFAAAVRQRLDPSWLDHGGNERFELVFDVAMHAAFLGEAVRLQSPRLFTEYAAWTRDLMRTAGGDVARFESCVRAMAAQLRDTATGDWVPVALEIIDAACGRMAESPPPSTSYFADDRPHNDLAKAFLDACLKLHRQQALNMIRHALTQGVPLDAIYLDVITPAMHELGRLWHTNQVTVAQEHYCTAVAQMVMAQSFPALFEQSSRRVGNLVSVCIAGELHEIGARMVADLFELNGWDSVFLGADVPKESVIDMLIETDADVLAISTTLAANLGAAADLIRAVREVPACAAVRILVGGAAFNVEPELWRRLGADGWAPDAPSAIQFAAQWSH